MVDINLHHLADVVQVALGTVQAAQTYAIQDRITMLMQALEQADVALQALRDVLLEEDTPCP